MLSSFTGSAVTERPKAAPIPTVNPEGKLIKKGTFLLVCSNPAAVESKQHLSAEGRGWCFQERALKLPRQQHQSLTPPQLELSLSPGEHYSPFNIKIKFK